MHMQVRGWCNISAVDLIHEGYGHRDVVLPAT
jgi:hypothetical protein